MIEVPLYYRDLVLLREGGMFQDMERMDVLVEIVACF